MKVTTNIIYYPLSFRKSDHCRKHSQQQIYFQEFKIGYWAASSAIGGGVGCSVHPESIFFSSSSTQASQACQPFGIVELVQDLSGKNKSLHCPPAGHRSPLYEYATYGTTNASTIFHDKYIESMAHPGRNCLTSIQILLSLICIL